MEECIKCGSPLNDEIWKTDGLEFEEYICSNNKCCAVHTINIIRWDDDGRRKEECVDIERLWDTLEFSYIWEEGLKPIAAQELSFTRLEYHQFCFITPINPEIHLLLGFYAR